jgi:hypothetical protein
VKQKKQQKKQQKNPSADGSNLLEVEESPHSQIILLSKTLQSTYLQHQLETMK